MAAVATFQRALANVRKRTQDGLGVKLRFDMFSHFIKLHHWWVINWIDDVISWYVIDPQ